MDYKNYLEKRESGNAEIIAAGGGFAIAVKKYDVETGEPTTPEITALDLVKLEEEKAELQKKIADIDTVILEIKGLSTK
jgi:hypothetical protein